MSPLVFHGESTVPARGLNDYVGSPMYEVIAEHQLAYLAVGVVLLGAWAMGRMACTGTPWAESFVSGYRRLPLVHRFVAWMLVLAGAIHVFLVFGHEPGWYSVGYAVLGSAQLVVARLLIRRGRWRRPAAFVLTASLGGYAISSMTGAAPDQAGLATKLVELAALVVVATSARGRRWRQAGRTFATTALGLLVAIGAWVGAFSSGAGGHHIGETPPPGVLVPTGEDREPTANEQRRADALYDATVAATARYEDPEAARAAGYDVEGMTGLDFHAENESYKHDEHVLDPEYPETLIYAVTEDRPVLIGVMYQVGDIGEHGPAVGGPLTVWHAHDHVCFSLVPPALSGLTSPFGTCPAGSITLPITNEMIHVWTLPGVPERYGDLDDAWLDAYLAGLSATGEPPADRPLPDPK
jgi:hypothetical protein